MKLLQRLFLLISILTATLSAQGQRESIDLSGAWQVSLGSPDAEAVEAILPGTLDTNGIGAPNDNFTETTQLSRKVTYEGPAYFTREVEVPESWAGKHVQLFIERSRPTSLWIDDTFVGECDYLSVPHVYDATQYLQPGKHAITVMVDNGERIPAQIKSNSHSCTEATQTNWNGLIGRIELQAMSPTRVASLVAQPLPDKRVKAIVEVDHPEGGKNLIVRAADKACKIKLQPGQREYLCVLSLGSDAPAWSERNPSLITVSAEIPGCDATEVRTGLVDFRAEGKHFYANDSLTFLRGKHDGCVFPLTGHVPMDVDSWRRYFSICKEYGINHVRFHSWCPPEACFEAADLEGIYLQPELTIWGTFNADQAELMDFLHADGMEIVRQYQHHPSFVLFSLGNELWGEEPLMEQFVGDFREVAPRQLYACGTNSYLGYRGTQPAEDFFATCRAGAGDGYDGYSSHVRASFSFSDAVDGGLLNHSVPSTDINFEAALADIDKPVIGHETGQYQIYPDYAEMAKYTGVLEPRNFAVFQQRLADAGMAAQALDFHNASGRWAAELYKADMEMNFRTPSMAGFQLLDLQDYPGQGTALVGVLDAFMESKGIVDPQYWRQSCSDIVLLAEMPKRCYADGECLPAKLAVANYSGRDLAGQELGYSLVGEGDALLHSGSVAMPAGQGYVEVADIELPLNIAEPQKVKLRLAMPGEGRDNEYSLWVYPASADVDCGNVVLTESIGDALSALADGRKVLLLPRHEDVDSATVDGLFQTDYWNYRMFATISRNNDKPVSPGTMGLLIDAKHPALASFPTDDHTDWQWFVPVKHGYPLVLDALNDVGYRPIVQTIDNIERNHRLGMLMEMAVGEGKLMMLMADKDQLMQAPEGRQLLRSILAYMGTADFAPAQEISAQTLSKILRSAANAAAVKELRNISYD